MPPSGGTNNNNHHNHTNHNNNTMATKDPDRPTPPVEPKSTTYKFKDGDILSQVAVNHGLKAAEWTRIWELPENKSIASKRGKPESIQPGDTFIIPPSEQALADYKKKLQEYEEAVRKYDEISEEIDLQWEVFEGMRMKLRKSYQAIPVILERDADRIRSTLAPLKLFNDDGTVVGFFLKNEQGALQVPSDAKVSKAAGLIKQLDSMCQNAEEGTTHEIVQKKIIEAQDALEEANDELGQYLKSIGREADTPIIHEKLNCYEPFPHKSFENIPWEKRADVYNDTAMVLQNINETICAWIGNAPGGKANPAETLGEATKAALDEAADSKKLGEKINTDLQKKISIPGIKVTVDHISKWIEGAGSSFYKNAVKAATSGVKPDTRLDAFVSNISAKIAGDFPGKELSSWLDKNIGQKIHALIKPKGVNLNDFLKVAKPIYTPHVAKVAQQAFDKAIAKAKSAAEIGEEIAEAVAKQAKAAIEKALEKQKD